jgi:valyl-tRNA synthetase
LKYCFKEGTKPGFKSLKSDVIISHKYTLAKCLEVTLRILAPITPYLSDDLYSKLSKKLSVFEFKSSLLESSYPTSEEVKYLRKIELEENMCKVIKLIKFLRSVLSNVPKCKDVQGTSTLIFI